MFLHFPSFPRTVSCRLSTPSAKCCSCNIFNHSQVAEVSAFSSFASHNRSSPRYPDKKVFFTPQVVLVFLKNGCQIRGLNMQQTVDIEISGLVRIRTPREEGRFVTRRETRAPDRWGAFFSPHRTLARRAFYPNFFPLGTRPSPSIVNDTAALTEDARSTAERRAMPVQRLHLLMTIFSSFSVSGLSLWIVDFGDDPAYVRRDFTASMPRCFVAGT